jgi:hypothetical protein
MVGSYINKDKNDGEGRPDEMEGNSVGPFVVPKNESGVAQSAGTATDPMHTQHVDSNGRVEGEVGYVGPTVQTTNKVSGTIISGETDPTAVFANNATANTQATAITITKPDSVSQMHQISVYNPSTVSDLTVKVFTVATGLGGGDRDVLVDTLIIPKAQAVSGTTIVAYAETVYNWMNLGNGKIVVSNNTALGAAEGFTATVRVREI